MKAIGKVEEIGNLLRRYSGLSSEETKNSSELSFHSSELSFHSSELSFHSSELSFHSSEVSFPGSVESFRFLVSYWEIPREISDLAKMYES